MPSSSWATLSDRLVAATAAVISLYGDASPRSFSIDPDRGQELQ